MAIDYKKELEYAARNMIFVHDPDLLIKMIVRMVVNNAHIAHASFFLHNKEKQGYLLTVSRGSLGKKVPLDLICIDKDDVLIRFFREHIFGKGIERIKKCHAYNNCAYRHDLDYIKRFKRHRTFICAVVLQECNG